jgi:hypothetical protein
MIMNWITDNGALLALLGGLSILTFFGTIIALPLIIISIPEDYFVDDHKAAAAFAESHPLLRLVFHILKNILGVIFILAGFVMLFIPGQGLLTIFIGLTLLDFPGKRRLELKLIRYPRIHRAIDWIRRKGRKKPLLLP